MIIQWDDTSKYYIMKNENQWFNFTWPLTAVLFSIIYDHDIFINNTYIKKNLKKLLIKIKRIFK